MGGWGGWVSGVGGWGVCVCVWGGGLHAHTPWTCKHWQWSLQVWMHRDTVGVLLGHRWHGMRVFAHV